MVVLGAGATFGTLLVDADVAMPYPMMAISAMAAVGPTQRGPPESCIVVLTPRSPNISMSSSMISMISADASIFMSTANLPAPNHRYRRSGRRTRWLAEHVGSERPVETGIGVRKRHDDRITSVRTTCSCSGRCNRRAAFGEHVGAGRRPQT
jgi:hypothetical protein